MAENIEGGMITPSPAAVGHEPRHFRNVAIAWVVLSIIGIVAWIFLAPLILPPAASDIGSVDNTTIVVLTALAIPVAGFVFVFLAYSMLFFRIKERTTEDPVPLKPRPGLQISWLGVTGLLCIFLFFWGLVAYTQEHAVAATPDTLIVNVTGQQWYWSFQYPQYGLSTQGQVIELPVNRPVKFFVTSEDVLHGFAIRDLGVRIDANPGEETTTPVVTPSVIGSYTVNCVEMCGLLHTYMWEAVNVVNTNDFNTWITSQGGHP